MKNPAARTPGVWDRHADETPPTRRKRITVGEFEIEHGTRFNSFECPVSMAVQHVLKEGLSVSVNPLFLCIYTFPRTGPDGPVGPRYMVPLPDRLFEFVNVYDAHGREDDRVRPLTCYLDLPVEVLP